MEKCDTKWLEDRLPPIEKIELKGEANFYGASYLIASKLGMKHPPRSYAHWRHGWAVPPVTHPRQLARGKPQDMHLVATEEHVQILKKFGFKKTEAVGLPFIYADDVQVERMPGSLLVMPAHSLPYTNHDWDQATYAKEIAALKPYFSTVVACISNACVAKGYWTSEFDKQGIPWVVGAEVKDKNALIRMNCLFKSFDFMTTNVIGSHVAYAAYSGCKVSIYGKYASREKEDYTNDPWYKKHPDLLEVELKKNREKSVREKYPELFIFPADAVERKLWGKEMVGADFKKSPKQVARLLGWSTTQRINRYIGRRLSQLKRIPRKTFRLPCSITRNWKAMRTMSK